MTSVGPLPRTSVRAFPAHPCADRYYAGGSVEECRVRLMRAIERGDGPALLIGAAGMGKTMLLGVLAESLAGRFRLVSIASTQLCTRKALLQAILFGLDLPYADRDEGELRLALAEYVQDAERCPSGVALLIDEAQALPVRLLEELRIVSNAARGGEPLVRLVLAGSSALEEQFASTELESFNQRLAARCYLAPLSYGETLQYVRAHVAAAGAEPHELFDQAALDSVYAASDGVPRLINQVCDRAIVMAIDERAETVSQRLIQAAWSDLHQLPAPWHTPEPSLGEPESSVVEFGVLADIDDDAQALAAEAEPPAGELKLPMVEPPRQGEWNADRALEAFGFSYAPAKPLPPADEPAPAKDKSAPKPAPTRTPDASELFGEGYDEEEVVIDRFVSIEAVFTPTTPSVVNRQDQSIGAEIGRHERPVVEAEPAQAAAADQLESIVDEADGEGFHVLSMQRREPVAVEPLEEAALEEGTVLDEDEQADGADEADVLIIERDPAPVTTVKPPVERREYRQLFASLRRCD